MTRDFADVPLPPPRLAKSFRKFGRWFLLAVAFVTPFFFLPVTEDPVGINKFVLVGLLTIAALVCFLGCVVEERKIDYPRSLLGLSLLLFLIVQGVSTWFSIAQSQSLFGGLRAPDSLISFVIYCLLFFLFFFFFRKEGDILRVGLVAGAGLLVAVVLASFNPIGSFTAWGVFMIAGIAALVVVRPGDFVGRSKLYFFLALGIALLALIYLNSQSLWLALAIFIMAVAMLRFEPREHFQYAFAIITLSLFLALVSSRLPISSKLAQDIHPNISTSLGVVQNTLKGPEVLTGSGPATFALDTSAFPSVLPQGHDFAVTLLATGGILSFLLFLWIIVLAIQPFLHIHRLDTQLAMVASASAFLLVALFLYPASFAELVLLFVLLGVMQGVAVRGTISFDAMAPWKSFIFSIAGMVGAAAVLAGAFVLGEKYAGAVFFGQANVMFATGDVNGSFAKMNNAIALDPSDEYYRMAANILVTEAKTLSALSDPSAPAELSAVIQNAVRAAESAVADNSRDPANWGSLGSTYEAMMPIVSGADSSAGNGYLQAAVLDPADPRWDVDIARVYMESASLLAAGSSNDPARQTDWANVESFLEKAISIKSDYADARVLLVQLYLQEGNIAQAIQKVQELKQQNPLDAGVAFELGYLYYQSNQIEQAGEEFQVATILDPNYSNAHYFLGLIYDQKGAEAQALAEFQKLQTLNPGNQQVATIIANLQAGRSALASVNSQTSLSGSEAQTQIVTPNASSTATLKKGK